MYNVPLLIMRGTLDYTSFHLFSIYAATSKITLRATSNNSLSELDFLGVRAMIIVGLHTGQ